MPLVPIHFRSSRDQEARPDKMERSVSTFQLPKSENTNIFWEEVPNSETERDSTPACRKSVPCIDGAAMTTTRMPARTGTWSPA
jgi:hypothetical protein